MKIAVITLSLFLWSATTVHSKLVTQQTQTATLYSKNKYKEDPRTACFNLDAALRILRCDLRYGTLYAGDDLDWFQSGASATNRSVIRDLGAQAWTDPVKVPVIEALPKLEPGEQRHVIIDTSGADGTAGLPGEPAQNGLNVDGTRNPAVPMPVPPPALPKNEGTPKIDPIFVKVIAGHMYVIHVVDQKADFYALFRVEALERGDSCTISWRKISRPAAN